MEKAERWHYGCPASETYIKLRGVTVSRCRNLAGIVRYNSRARVVTVETRRDPAGPVRGDLRVTYADGAQGFASFASYHIMVDWVRRRRIFKTARIIFNNEDIGYQTKPGVLSGGL